MLAYPVHIKKDGKFLMATFDDMPEAGTNGIGLEETLSMAADALITAFDFYFSKGKAIPKPSKPKDGQRVIKLPISVSAKVLLWNEMIRQDVKPAELARRLGISRQAAQRLTYIRHATKIDTIAEAAALTGRSPYEKQRRHPERSLPRFFRQAGAEFAIFDEAS
jgi:antitoxin HicB